MFIPLKNIQFKFISCIIEEITKSQKNRNQKFLNTACAKTKSFVIVDSEILPIKNEMSFVKLGDN